MIVARLPIIARIKSRNVKPIHVRQAFLAMLALRRQLHVPANKEVKKSSIYLVLPSSQRMRDGPFSAIWLLAEKEHKSQMAKCLRHCCVLKDL
jgi:hypothetical protein